MLYFTTAAALILQQWLSQGTQPGPISTMRSAVCVQLPRQAVDDTLVGEKLWLVFCDVFHGLLR
jgi:hypothetical protein